MVECVEKRKISNQFRLPYSSEGENATNPSHITIHYLPTISFKQEICNETVFIAIQGVDYPDMMEM